MPNISSIRACNHSVTTVDCDRQTKRHTQAIAKACDSAGISSRSKVTWFKKWSGNEWTDATNCFTFTAKLFRDDLPLPSRKSHVANRMAQTYVTLSDVESLRSLYLFEIFLSTPGQQRSADYSLNSAGAVSLNHSRRILVTFATRMLRENSSRRI